MSKNKHYPISRRNFIKVSAATTAGVSLLPLGACKVEELPRPMTRRFGDLDFDVTTIALGGQASLQWTPADVDPVPIILKAFEMGINYLLRHFKSLCREPVDFQQGFYEIEFNPW